MNNVKFFYEPAACSILVKHLLSHLRYGPHIRCLEIPIQTLLYIKVASQNARALVYAHFNFHFHSTPSEALWK